MHNHAHLLIKTEKIQEMSNFMHKVNTNYAIYYNNNKKRVGHVFRDRFKSEQILSKEYLYNCINYIHKNPVKAGICKNEEDYPFSSIKSFNNYKNLFMLLPYSEKVFIDLLGDMNNEYTLLIDNFININGLKKEELKQNKEKLKELLIILTKQNNMSKSEASKRLGISRKTVRNILDLE